MGGGLPLGGASRHNQNWCAHSAMKRVTGKARVVLCLALASTVLALAVAAPTSHGREVQTCHMGY
eukprot:6468223-Amphidinium_carterae.1